MLSNEEAFDMLMLLGECRQNYRAAERLYRERYPERVLRSRKVFRRLAFRVRTYGQCNWQHNNHQNIRRPVRDEREADVLAAIAENPHDSTRRLAADSGVSQATVWRILNTNRYHPYHVHLHQELSEEDFRKRLDLCQWLLTKDQNFFRSILWTDESTFKSNGNINVHNVHYWSPVNPHWLRTVDNQHMWSVNIWCGVIGDQIVGPYVFDGSLNGARYADFLENVLYQLLENVPLARRAIMWMQQDGCPAHSSLVARRVLNNMYPGRWIGRGGPVAWPPRSPDLTPMDFFCWGRIKDIVYQHRPTTRDDMMERIRNACQSLSSEEILRATDSVRTRLQQCVHQGGRHFEHL